MESEFLQMTAFVLLTTFLYQKGSAESKRIGVIEEVDLDPRRFADQAEAPWPVKRGGFVLTLYENSLGMAFAGLFLISIAMHAVGGLAEFNNEQVGHGEQAVTLARYVASSRFWFESFQNWQSEFLSLAAMVIGTIYLRQRYSGESKPVFASHEETGKLKTPVPQVLSFLHERIPVVARRRERFLDRSGADPADQVELRAGLVVGAGPARAAERLLPDHGAGGLVVDVEVAGGIAQRARAPGARPRDRG